MSLLPKPRALAYGGELPQGLPEDPQIAERKKKLAAQQGTSDGVVENLGSVASAAPQVISALSTLGVGGLGTAATAATTTTAAVAGTGAAGLAGAAGPIGAAVAAGAFVGGKLRAGQVDDQGFVKTGTSNKLLGGVAGLLDPIGNATSVWGRDDLNVGTKILATLAPGSASSLTAGADEAAKKKAQEESRRRFAENAQLANAAATRRTYGGMAGGFRRGGLLPRAFALGGGLPGDPMKPKEDAVSWMQRGLVRATRAVLPLNAAMAVQDVSAGLARKYLPASSTINTSPRVPLTERDLNPAQLNALRSAARNSNPDTREITYGSYGRAGDSPDSGGIYGKLTNPTSQMVTTVGGAMLSPDGRRVTDSFDFGGTDATNHQTSKAAGATFLSTLKNQGLYEGVRYAEGELGSTTDGQGIPVNINLGGAYKPKPRPKVAAPVGNGGWGTAASAPTSWAKGGLLPSGGKKPKADCGCGCNSCGGKAEAHDHDHAESHAKGGALAKRYSSATKGQQLTMDAQYASARQAGQREFVSSVTGQRLSVKENEPRAADAGPAPKPGQFQLEHQLTANRLRGNFAKPYLMVDDRLSKAYVVSGNHRVEREFPVVTGQNTGEKAAEGSRIWRNRPENEGKSFEKYVDFLTASKQRVTPSGEFEVSKKDGDPAAPRGWAGNLKQAVHDSGLGDVLNQAGITDSVNYDVRGTRRESYGNKLLALNDPSTGLGIGPAVHGTGHQNRLDAMKTGGAGDRKLSAGCINGSCEDIDATFKRLSVGSRVQLLPEDSTSTVRQPVPAGQQPRKTPIPLDSIKPKFTPAAESTGTSRPRALVKRAQGGLLPGANDPTPPGRVAKAVRKVLPLNAAMYLQDMAGDKTPLTNADLSEPELNALRAAARKKGAGGTSIGEDDYRTDYSQASLAQKLRNPDTRMATTIGGATLRKQGPGNNTQLTDTFDYNEYSADDKTGRAFEGKSLLARNGLYSKLRYLGGIFGSADGEGAPVKVNLGNLKRPRAGEFGNGGLLPKSVIVSGALHSETNKHQGHATAGKRGVPVLAANGTRLAEVERDELTLHDKASAKIERLRSAGGLLALGRTMQQEILTNTTASPRFAKRLS